MHKTHKLVGVLAVFCVTLFAIGCTGVFAQVQNPSYETMDFTNWTTYGYGIEGEQGNATPPAVKKTGSGGFDVLYPNQGPADGLYVAGYQGWSATPQGGCYQTFTASAVGNVIISERAWSLDWGFAPYDIGVRVRAAVVPGTVTDRAAVTEWTEGAWGNGWNNIVLPVTTPGVYTLFIENHIPWNTGIWSALWDNVRFGQIVQITNGPTISNVTETTATISWDTDVAGTTELSYDKDGPAYFDTVMGDFGTHHEINLVNLDPGTVYHFSVTTQAADRMPVTTSDATFFTTYPISPMLRNGDFEAKDAGNMPTLGPWVQFAGPKNVLFDGLFGPNTRNTNFYSGMPRSPEHLAGAAESGGNDKTLSGIFQKVATTPGTWYKAQSWIWTWQTHTGNHASSDDTCRVGIDPTGGTDPNAATVAWSSWQYTQPWDDPNGQPSWKQIGTVAKAESDVSTVFLQVQHLYGLEWNVTHFDDVTFGDESQVGTINYQNHIGKAKVNLGEGFPVELTDKMVTSTFQMSVPDGQPSTRYYCYIQEADGSAGIKVDYTNISGLTLYAGDRIDVKGSLDTLAQETQVSATSLIVSTPNPGSAELPKPLYTTGKNIASGSLGMQPAIPGYSGLSNVGVRVRIAGTVTSDAMPDSSGYGYVVYVDDGSNPLNDSVFFSGGVPAPGVKVVLQTLSGNPPMNGDHVAVTGVASIDYNTGIGSFPKVIVADSYSGVTTY